MSNLTEQKQHRNSAAKESIGRASEQEKNRIEIENENLNIKSDISSENLQ